MASPETKRLGTAPWLVGKMTGLATHWPGLTLLFALALAIGSCFLAATKLEFKTSRLDLLDPNSEYNQRWLKFLDKYGKRDDAVVVIDGTNQAEVARCLRDLGEELEKDNTFRGVMYRKSLGKLETKALYWLSRENLQQVQQLLAALRQQSQVHTPITQLPDALDAGALKPVQQPVHSTPALASLATQWKQMTPPTLLYASDEIPIDFESLASGAYFLTQDLESLKSFLQDPTQPPPLGNLGSLQRLTSQLPNSDRDDGLLLDDEGCIGLCLIPLLHPDDDPAASAKEISTLREHIADFREEFPTLKIGLTGMPILEADESAATTADMGISTIISFVGVAVLFVWGVGSFRYPVLAMIALAIGLAWTIGFATLTIGHLNLLSAAFGAILIGLGIDYGIHFVTRLAEQQRQNSGEDFEQILVETSQHCGPGIWIGGLTTAVAFASAAVTPFQGIAELGVITAGGTILCVISALTVLPAIIRLTVGKRNQSTVSSNLSEARNTGKSIDPPTILARLSRPVGDTVEQLSDWASQNPLFVLCVCFLFALSAGLLIPNLKFDHNLLHLQATGVESVETEHVLIERSGQSAWYAVASVDNPTKAVALAGQFAALQSVARVDQVANLFLPEALEPETQSLVKAIRETAEAYLKVVQSSQPETTTEADLKELFQFWLQLLPATEAGQVDLQNDPMATLYSQIRSNVLATNEIISRMPPEELNLRLRQFELARRSAASELLRQVIYAADPSPPTVAELPTGIQQRLISPRGEFQIRVFPKGNVWDREPLEKFVRDLEGVDNQITGHPIQTYYASGELQRSYELASLYATIAIAIILMVDFQSISFTVLAMIPASISIAVLLGLMSFLGKPLNPANMIALPLILGIGIDDGVHLVEQFRYTKGKYRLDRATAIAVLLTSVTTMAGFGSLMVSQHQGLFSLGWVLTVGIGLCWLHSVLVLPALLSILQSDSARRERLRAIAREHREEFEFGETEQRTVPTVELDQNTNRRNSPGLWESPAGDDSQRSTR